MSTVFNFSVAIDDDVKADRIINAFKDIGLYPGAGDDEVMPLDEAIKSAFPDKTIDEVAGMILKDVRVEAKLTQKELAEKLGTTKSVISAMERGKRPVSKAMAKKLGKIFNVPRTAFL